MPKYAQTEHERRFLIRDCPDLSAESFRFIEDFYISGSRLRLRSITHGDGQPPEFKFCKKYPSGDIGSGAIVNIYLTAEEHGILSRLPGSLICKRRYRCDVGATACSIDVFERHLAGLVLGEVETGSAARLPALALPAWAINDVTADPFFTGGHLATIGARDLSEKLSLNASA